MDLLLSLSGDDERTVVVVTHDAEIAGRAQRASCECRTDTLVGELELRAAQELLDVMMSRDEEADRDRCRGGRGVRRRRRAVRRSAPTSSLPSDESKAVIDEPPRSSASSRALTDALKQALKNRVDAAVEAGRLTEEQADELKKRIDSGRRTRSSSAGSAAEASAGGPARGFGHRRALREPRRAARRTSA